VVLNGDWESFIDADYFAEVHPGFVLSYVLKAGELGAMLVLANIYDQAPLYWSLDGLLTS
jgi:hypothetical protein